MEKKKTKNGLRVAEGLAIVLVLLLVAYTVILIVHAGTDATYLKAGFKYFLATMSFGALYGTGVSIDVLFVLVFALFYGTVIISIACFIAFMKKKCHRELIGILDFIIGSAMTCFALALYAGSQSAFASVSGTGTKAVMSIGILVVLIAYLLGLIGLVTASFSALLKYADLSKLVPAKEEEEVEEVEEEEEPIEEPVPEEEPVKGPEEVILEEEILEPVVEEEIVEETVEEPVVEEEIVEETVEEPVVGDSRKIERVPFTDKLANAEPELLAKYEELKAYLLAYGVKSRISVDGDSYRLHKVLYVHITIAGKKMKVYYRLNPADFETSTFPVKDASQVKKYADIPLELDVKSDLSVRRAKELIDRVLQEAGFTKPE